MLSFAEDFEDDQYLLFEMPNAAMLEALMSGDGSIEIVTDGDKPLCVCTRDETFELLEHETSNTLLACQDDTILSKHHTTFEIRHLPTPLFEVRSRLSQEYLTIEEIMTGSIYPITGNEELFQELQISPAEYLKVMKQLAAVNVNGFPRILHPEVYRRVAERVCGIIIPSTESLRISATSPELNDIAKEFGSILVVKAVIISMSVSSNEEFFVMDSERVSQSIAEKVLTESNGNTMRKEEFKDEMIGLLPSAITFDFSLFYGMSYTTDTHITYVDESILPPKPRDRFNALFEIKKAWITQEIEPFFRYLVTPKLSFTDLAMRYTRLADGMWMAK